MANKDEVVLKVSVGGVEKSISSLKDAKDALSDLKKEQENLALGSEAYKKNQKAIEDLNASIKEVTKTDSQRAKEAEKNAEIQTNALKRIQQELKAAKAAALNGDGKAAQRVAELTDQMNDLRDATQTMSGSGVERAQSSLSMLGEGFKNLDFDKIKTAFKGLGSAMKAVPIFLLMEGISYLVEHFDELSKGTGPLATVLRKVGDALHWISDVIGSVVTFFTDMAGATSDATRALEAQGKAIKENADKTNAALQSQIKNFDEQIAIAKASGKSTVALEIAKQQAIIDTNLTIARQIEAFVRAGGEFDDEKKKMLTASLEAIRGAKVSEQIIEINDHKAKEDNYKKHLDELRKIKEDRDKEIEAFNERLKATLKAQDEKNRAEEAKEEEETAASRKAAQIAMREDEYRLDKERNAQIIKEDEEAKAKAKKTAQEIAAAKVAIENQSFVAAKGLSDAFFAVKLAGAKGNAAAELEIKKKQFQIDKAFAISRAVIDGIRSVQSALASAPPPFSIVLAGINGALAAANVAKIAASSFDGGGSASVGGGGGGSVSAPSTGATPQTQAPTTIAQNETRFNDKGENLSFKTHVVESEMTSSQQRIARLREQAKL